MKKQIIVGMALASLLLVGTGCGLFGGDEQEEKPRSADANSYQHESFSISPPKDWETVTTFTKEYPKGIVVAFRNNVKDDNFTANINMLQKTVPEGFTSIDFALQELKNHEKNLLNYKENSRENTKITVGGQSVDTLLLYFQGKQNAEDDVIKFLQIFGVKGTVGFVATGALPENSDEDSVKKIEEALRTFVVK